MVMRLVHHWPTISRMMINSVHHTVLRRASESGVGSLKSEAVLGGVGKNLTDSRLLKKRVKITKNNKKLFNTLNLQLLLKL